MILFETTVTMTKTIGNMIMIVELNVRVHLRNIFKTSKNVFINYNTSMCAASLLHTLLL